MLYLKQMQITEKRIDEHGINGFVRDFRCVYSYLSTLKGIPYWAA